MLSATCLAILLCLAAIFGTTAFHYEALHLIGRFVRDHSRPRIAVPTVLTLVISAHLVEIVLYMIVYRIASGPLALGSFSGERSGVLGLFYYAAETYASLGAGNVFPHGELRVISSASSLNGILLLAWSGAFLYAVTDSLEPIRRR